MDWQTNERNGYMDSFRGFLRQGEVTSEISVGVGVGIGVGPYSTPTPTPTVGIGIGIGVGIGVGIGPYSNPIPPGGLRVVVQQYSQMLVQAGWFHHEAGGEAEIC